MSDLTYREAADILGVSTATVQNWTRQGVLRKKASGEMSERDVYSFRDKLRSGTAGRLMSRANKNSARRSFLPGEYIDTPFARRIMTSLAARLEALNYSPGEILFAYFHIKISRSGNIAGSNNRTAVNSEMDHWFRELGRPDLTSLEEKLAEMNIPEQRDTAGLLYQMLQKEGRKSRLGSYYTPAEIASEIISSRKGKWTCFLDPCCGSGIFLLIAAEEKHDPLSVEGWDSDPLAVRIARLNLLLAFPEMTFTPRIHHRDTLLFKEKKTYDFIASNPPWGHHFTRIEKEELLKLYPDITSGESFSFFILAAMNHLEPGGTLSFLLPESILKVKAHRDIRKIIMEKFHITRLCYLGKPFRNVQTEVVRMDLEKSDDRKAAKVIRRGEEWTVLQNRFSDNINCIFDFNCNDRDYEIFRRIYGKGRETMEGKATWILGIVSGNNRKFLRKGLREGYLPVLSGRDITPFRIAEPENSILFDRAVLQQCAPGELYESTPKIVYRFITGKPVFAVDRKGLATLNSANSFRPAPDVNPSIIVFFFNSSLYRFVLARKFNSLKILREHLEQLPLPDLTSAEKQTIENMTETMEISSADTLMNLLRAMDEWVFNFFEIPHSDRSYILETL